MRNVFPSLFTLSVFIFCSTAQLQAEEGSAHLTETRASPPAAPRFEPFTGKITKNKVRLRLQPTYDGPVLKELKRNDLLVILGEVEDFYAVQPPTDIQAYVFRTYVLDNVVEEKMSTFA